MLPAPQFILQGGKIPWICFYATMRYPIIKKKKRHTFFRGFSHAVIPEATPALISFLPTHKDHLYSYKLSSQAALSAGRHQSSLNADRFVYFQYYWNQQICLLINVRLTGIWRMLSALESKAQQSVWDGKNAFTLVSWSHVCTLVGWLCRRAGSAQIPVGTWIFKIQVTAVILRKTEDGHVLRSPKEGAFPSALS